MESVTPSKLGTRDEMGRLEKVSKQWLFYTSGWASREMLIYLISQLVKKYERGDLPKSDWLDTMAFRKMEEIHSVCLLSQ
jgi:phosphatidylinositol 3-kinase